MNSFDTAYQQLLSARTEVKRALGSRASFVEISKKLDAAQKEAQAQNASRPAVVEMRQTSTGVGQHRLTKTATFPVIFSTEPHFTCGSAVVKGTGTGLFHDPRGSSGVWAWERDGNGRYIGARLWVRVDIDPVAFGQALDDALSTKLTQIEVIHFFTFTGTAVKDVFTPKTSDIQPHEVKLL